MVKFEVGTPYMDQVPACSLHLKALAFKGARVVGPHITPDGGPSFPAALRGSVTADGGTFVSFESITPDHAVMHMQRTGISSRKVAETGHGFFYGLPTDMTANEARLLAAGLKQP